MLQERRLSGMDEQRTSQLITVAFVRSVKMCWVIYSCNSYLYFAVSFVVGDV